MSIILSTTTQHNKPHANLHKKTHRHIETRPHKCIRELKKKVGTVLVGVVYYIWRKIFGGNPACFSANELFAITHTRTHAQSYFCFPLQFRQIKVCLGARVVAAQSRYPIKRHKIESTPGQCKGGCNAVEKREITKGLVIFLPDGRGKMGSSKRVQVGIAEKNRRANLV